MRKNIFKKLAIVCLGVSVLVSGVGLAARDVKAATEQCTTYTGDNVEEQNYGTWSSVINSYLDGCDNGELMRLQAGALDAGVLVEYYDSSYNIKRTVNVTDGLLPVFGGFYSTGTNYYIISGQNNPDESNSVEVYRITKYDLNWNVLGQDGLYGANTYIPFDAGSVRMTTSGKYLLVRTCHEMYVSDDGYHHQANVTIQFDMDSMKITDSYTDVMNSSYGYVSHSFNQFIRTDGTSIVGVDHGDANPRSIVLVKYNTDFTTGSFVPDYYTRCNVIDMMAFPEADGYSYNYTGASVGGFELSSDNYIVVGNTVDQSNVATAGTRNIFVATVDRKLSNSPVVTNITNYAEGTASATTPHLIKLNDSRFILMWSRDGMVYWTAIDGNGKQTGTTYNMPGSLSDCVPIVYNDKLIWYVWDNDKVTFYDISTSNLASYNKTEIAAKGHKYVTTTVKATTAKDGSIVKKCSVCGKLASQTVIAYPKTISLSRTAFTYNGKEQKPTVSVKDSKGNVIPSSNYTVTYPSGCKNAGAYTVKITFNGNYSGTANKSFVINKASNTITVKPVSKTVKYSSVRKKAQKIKIKVAKNKGKVSYKTGSRQLTVKSGVITLKKGTRKGKYTVAVTAKGDKNHKAKTVKVKITVK